MVEGHDHVGAEPPLDPGHPLRGEPVRAPVDVAAKGRAVVVDRARGGEREDLVAAGVGQDRAAPAHEVTHSAAALDDLVAGAQVEVVGVGQQKRRSHAGQLVGREALHGAQRPDRHEHRSLDYILPHEEPPGAGRALDRVELEADAPSHVRHGITAMASPYE